MSAGVFVFIMFVLLSVSFAVKQECFSFYDAVQFLKNILWDRHLLGSRPAN